MATLLSVSWVGSVVCAGTNVMTPTTGSTDVSHLGVQVGSLTEASASLPQAQVYTGGGLLSMGCRTLDTYSNYTPDPANLERSTYGGWKARQVVATGFFRVEQIDGRWWAVDPEGYLYIHKALNSVNLNDYTPDEIYHMFRQYGFNGLGCWSDEDILDSTLKNEIPLAYCPKVSFIAEYRRDRDPRIEMPVFDDEFEGYCDDLAGYFLPYVNDPQVFGYLSDNELPWRDEGLPAHLEITDLTDQNYITAINFLTARGKTVDTWDTEDQYAYMALMAERYYSVVSAAIRKVDTNHMYIGTRCHSTEKQIKDFMVNAGRYVDVFSINHYNRWGSRDVEIHNMSEWSGRPLMVTEFYAMEDDPENSVQGAGWPVLDQASRGLFYQNYISTLAETGDLVGWHWFKFQDAGDGANKGVIDASGNLYTNLLADMKQMNDEIYSFIDYIDMRRDPDASLLPEADAYFKGPENHGADEGLWVKQSSGSVLRQSYLRFDASSLSTNIESAKIQLFSVATGSESSNYQAELVENNSWGEMTINYNNNPTGSAVLAAWSDGDDVEIDVTDVLLAALNGDKKLSIRIISTLKNNNIAEYGAREHTNAVARPRLCVTYHSGYEYVYAQWAKDKGLEDGVNDDFAHDPDFDDMDNLLEFSVGGDPLIKDRSIFIPTFGTTTVGGSDWLNYVYRRRITHEELGLNYNVGSTTNLLPGPATNDTEEVGVGMIDLEFQWVTNRVLIDVEDQQFMQLRITTE